MLNKVEHRKELECALSMKEKERDDLQNKKADLESESGLKSDGLARGDFSSVFPVVHYCGTRPRKDIRAVPIEHFGAVMAQFDMAGKEYAKHNAALRQQLTDLRRLVETDGRKCEKAAAAAAALRHTVSLQVPGGTAANGHRAKSTHAAGEAARVSKKELERKNHIIEREIHAGKLIMRKKEKAILEVTALLKDRKALLDDIDSINNDIRVTDRDAKAEKEVLQELIAEHDSVDAKLYAVDEEKSAASRLLVDDSVAVIKDEINETVNGARRSQERVIKAQDYRIDQLENRLSAIQRALDSNHLTREVNTIISRGWASKNALLTVGSDADMYDLEMIIPAQEKFHPSIHNLFLAENERLARRMSLLNIIAKEKEEVIDALACKVEALSRECQCAIQELDELVSGAAYEEDEQRLRAMEYIHEQRLHYADLFFERQKLKSLALKTQRKNH